MVPPAATDGGKGKLSGRQRGISGRGTPTRGNRLPVWPPVRRRLLAVGRTARTWEMGKGFGGRRAKIFFARWNSGGLRGCLKKEFVKKDTRQTGKFTTYPSCPFLQSPRPCRCPDAARRRSLRRASPTTHPGTDRPASSGREPAAPKDPKPGDFSDSVSPRPVRTSVFYVTRHSRHRPDTGGQTTAAQAPACFFAKKFSRESPACLRPEPRDAAPASTRERHRSAVFPAIPDGTGRFPPPPRASPWPRPHPPR